MVKFLFSCSASWSVESKRADPQLSRTTEVTKRTHCPPSSACLCVTAGPRCDCSSRLTSCDFVCSSSSSRASAFDELFTRPRADPRVLLVVRWLRHQPSRSSRGLLAASPAFTLSHRVVRGVVAFFGAVVLRRRSRSFVLLSSCHSMSLLLASSSRHRSRSRRHLARARG